ncbi:MAG: DNA polymerase III subunit gamma/tau [Candidatus Veblenbacteria bacterium]|nr:DNA polymerase III subunit gamma/tau [Candidatus Veblenbacteria bacterium]
MTSTLYRKYRPQTFAEVVGQEHVTRTLEHEVMQDKLAHAYLFCGMRGVGKTTVARLLAKAVNCQKRKPQESEPCNSCESCQAITAGRSLDLIEVDAASNRRIDDVREIREHIPYGPSQARYKVVIVDEVHMLTTEAFNALLKTLEEPPAHVLFVLCTTEVHKLPETIVSRCQRFDFRRILAAVLLERLRGIAQQEKVRVEESVLRQVVELAGGSSRDAESYLGKLLSLGEKNVTSELARLALPHADLGLALDFIGYLIAWDARAAVGLLNSFLAEGGDIAYFYRQVLELMRHMLMLKLGGDLAHEVTAELEPTLSGRVDKLSRELTQARLQRMLERWLKVEGSWRASDMWQLPLELAAVELASPEVESVEEPAPKAASARGREAGVAHASPATPIVPRPLSSSLDIDVVSERWPEVVSGLRDFNHSLSFILSVAHPVKLEEGILTVGFSYRLHLERVQDAKVRGVIEQALSAVFGTPLALKGIAEEAPVATSGDLLSNVLTTMGGRVVG